MKKKLIYLVFCVTLLFFIANTNVYSQSGCMSVPPSKPCVPPKENPPKIDPAPKGNSYYIADLFYEVIDYIFDEFDEEI